MFIASVLMIFAKLSVAVLLLTAMFTKGSSSLFDDAGLRSGSKKVAYLIEQIHAPYVLLIVFLLIGGSVICAVFLLLLMIGVGVAVKGIGIVGECNCYGSLSKKSERSASWLTVALILLGVTAATLRILGGPQLEMTESGLLLLPSCLGLAATASMLLKAAGSEREAREMVAVGGQDETVSATYGGGMVVGYEADDEPLLLGDIAATCPMIVFISLSSACTACGALKPIIFPITRMFSNRLRCVFLVDDLETYKTGYEDDLVLRVSPEFVSNFGAEKYPFGVIMDSRSLSIVGPLSYGDGIGALFFRALVVALRQQSNPATSPMP